MPFMIPYNPYIMAHILRIEYPLVLRKCYNPKPPSFFGSPKDDIWQLDIHGGKSCRRWGAGRGAGGGGGGCKVFRADMASDLSYHTYISQVAGAES